MATDPIYLFNKWFNEELATTGLNLPGACCLSTNGLDGHPNARMVSLKGVRDGEFVVTGPLDSRKGKEISASNKVALTFWWTHTQRQVRIQGEARQLSDKLSDHYFSERTIESRIVSHVSQQGEDLSNQESLQEKYKAFQNLIKHPDILIRPTNWGGFTIHPLRIEFMEFKETRFHDRTLYEREGINWKIKKLQP